MTYELSIALSPPDTVADILENLRIDIDLAFDRAVAAVTKYTDAGTDTGRIVKLLTERKEQQYLEMLLFMGEVATAADVAAFGY